VHGGPFSRCIVALRTCTWKASPSFFSCHVNGTELSIGPEVGGFISYQITAADRLRGHRVHAFTCILRITCREKREGSKK
jgi:hypothetical protein